MTALAKLEKIRKWVHIPRSNSVDDEVVRPLFEILCVQLNKECQLLRSEVCITEDGEECCATGNSKKSPISGLNFRGKGLLHGESISSLLTKAQEAWIVLHVARCYYFHFGNNTPDCPPVTPQATHPSQGNSSSYTNKDVAFFRKVFLEINEARKKESKDLAEEKYMLVYSI